MFRSLITLLLLAGLSTVPLSTMEKINSFDASSLLTAKAIPVKKTEAVEPIIEAKAALLMDEGTGLVLYQKNPHQRLPMASLTKIMTAILILESHALDEIVTVQNNFNNEPELGVKMWLRQYEKITVENLLIGLLIRSAGDAALTLADFHSSSVDDFVEEMNRKAQFLNLRDTHFVNPIGLDDENHYSSAFDLAILTKYILRNSAFRRIVQIPKATVFSSDGKIEHQLESTNYLLNGYLDIRGVKTGTTLKAGKSLINLAFNEKGKGVIAVLLNSPQRFQENKRLIDWSFRNFRW